MLFELLKGLIKDVDETAEDEVHTDNFTLLATFL